MQRNNILACASTATRQMSARQARVRWGKMITRQVYKMFISVIASILLGAGIVSAADKTQVSGSAAAERSPDGTITSRPATTAEVESLEQFSKRLKEIDRKYPGPEIPKNAKLFCVTAVDNNGIITLENGQRIRLEGMKCSHETPDYLRRLLMGDMDRVVYIRSSTNNDNPAGAYIWHVDLSLMNDPEMKKVITGPSYSPLNEGALTSGWCTPARSSANAYNDRYEALSKVAPHR